MPKNNHPANNPAKPPEPEPPAVEQPRVITIESSAVWSGKITEHYEAMGKLRGELNRLHAERKTLADQAVRGDQAQAQEAEQKLRDVFRRMDEVQQTLRIEQAKLASLENNHRQAKAQEQKDAHDQKQSEIDAHKDKAKAHSQKAAQLFVELTQELAACRGEMRAMAAMLPGNQQAQFNYVLGDGPGTMAAGHAGLSAFVQLGAKSADHGNYRPYDATLAPFLDSHSKLPDLPDLVSQLPKEKDKEPTQENREPVFMTESQLLDTPIGASTQPRTAR